VRLLELEGWHESAYELRTIRDEVAGLNFHHDSSNPLRKPNYNKIIEEYRKIVSYTDQYAIRDLSDADIFRIRGTYK